MSELTEFLLREIAADEEAARAATPGPWDYADEHGNWPGAVPAWCVNEMRDGEWVGDVACLPQVERAEHDAAHIARHDPARVLADCEALRAVVAIHHPLPWEDAYCATCDEKDPYPCRTLRAIAQPFAGRPGWRDEWSTNGHKEAQG